MKRLLMVAASAAILPSGWAVARGHPTAPPAARHVFIIVLENQGFDTTFGPQSRAPYLADTLARAGALLLQYHGTAHFSLGNYTAMISGIAPTVEIQSDCPRYEEFIQTGSAPDGQPIGRGCIYPASVKTIANQLAEKRLTWKAYMEDMGADSTREAATCGHARFGMLDSTQQATPLDEYAAKHNPFVYFHAIVDSASCRANVVALTALGTALERSDVTANLSFITPNLCHDGHDRPCVNGEPGGLESADAFLRRWVPRIVASPAYQADGLLVIVFDEALSIDARACCDEQPGPNVVNAGVNGPGGGRTGAVLLSPFIRPGTRSSQPYNHYSLLRSLEDLFGLTHLGYAARRGLRPFGDDVYTRR